ncbi:MAG TPA: hypothetical protein ENH82_19125 [bacterium]|nr:hypothetical protein [bacterium]
MERNPFYRNEPSNSFKSPASPDEGGQIFSHKHTLGRDGEVLYFGDIQPFKNVAMYCDYFYLSSQNKLIGLDRFECLGLIKAMVEHFDLFGEITLKQEK